jgi:hypothetical protein
MTDTPPDSPATGDDSPDPRVAERLTLARQRLAEGYYDRPDILDRIADAVRRALQRLD